MCKLTKNLTSREVVEFIEFRGEDFTRGRENSRGLRPRRSYALGHLK